MKAQYDASAKRLLGQKIILAQILVKTVDEFKGMDPQVVAGYIEGTPYISTVPVEPGLTNMIASKNGERLAGFNTEEHFSHAGGFIDNISLFSLSLSNFSLSIFSFAFKISSKLFLL